MQNKLFQRVCNEINYIGLAQINETNGANLAFVLMYLLKFKSIKTISEEYKHRGHAIITDEKNWRFAFYYVYVTRI